MLEISPDRPADFYFGFEEEDRDAYRIIATAGIPCLFLGQPSDGPTPMLVVRGDIFVGLASIKDFVESHWPKGYSV